MQIVPDSYGSPRTRERNPCHDPASGKFTFSGRGECAPWRFEQPKEDDDRYRPLEPSEVADIVSHHGADAARLVSRINASRRLAFERAQVRHQMSRVPSSGHPVGLRTFTPDQQARLIAKGQRRRRALARAG